MQEGDDLHFQDNQYVEGQPLGLPADGCKLKRCVEETVGLNETEISRRQSELHEKTWGRGVKDSKDRNGKEITSLFQTASVLKGRFFF